MTLAVLHLIVDIDIPQSAKKRNIMKKRQCGFLISKIHQLAKKTALEKSTLTCMLESLEASGYIQCIPSEEDRRKTIIKLTSKNVICHYTLSYILISASS